MSSTMELAATLLAVFTGAIIIYWIAYHTGRLHGYEGGMKKGAELNARVQHLKGMSDGYVMAMQHTPDQRSEYVNNVLLRTGAITPTEVEADRRRRLALRTE